MSNLKSKHLFFPVGALICGIDETHHPKFTVSYALAICLEDFLQQCFANSVCKGVLPQSNCEFVLVLQRENKIKQNAVIIAKLLVSWPANHSKVACCYGALLLRKRTESLSL